MLRIPILRWGQPYTSLDEEKVVHFVTGDALAKLLLLFILVTTMSATVAGAPMIVPSLMRMASSTIGSRMKSKSSLTISLL